MEKWTKEELEYLKDLSEDYCVDLYVVMNLANILGRSELYDGLVTSLQDIEQ